MSVPELSSVADAAVWSGLAALGFAVLFNVPRRALLGCFLVGALGGAVKITCTHLGAHLEEATLAAAVVVGLAGAWSGRFWHTPVMVFSIPGAIPMVPGSLAFEAMIGIVQLSRQGSSPDPDLLSQTASMAARSALVLGALALGIALPRLLLRRDRLLD